MSMIRFLRKCILGMLFTTAMYAQNPATCPMLTAKNGEMVTFKAEAIHGAHDGLLRLADCKDEVVLTYADDPGLNEPQLTLKKDETFQRFRELFNEERAAQPDTICKGCWKYRVTAEFKGRLDIADSAGLKKDPKSGKVTGFVGFGHPLPFSRYRLVVTSISNVEASERPAASVPVK
jgi:hypothetical protein